MVVFAILIYGQQYNRRKLICKSMKKTILKKISIWHMKEKKFK
jgi:hypothetical protein